MSVKYVKLTNKECWHNGFQFVEGLNIDHIPFTKNNYCEPGGIYFTTLENIYMWLEYNDKEMYYIWDVIIPDDAQVYHQSDKSKADKIILRNRRTLSEFFSDDQDMLISSIKNYGINLKYVKKQTPELCLVAVKQSGIALKYVKEIQTQNGVSDLNSSAWYDEVCMKAVKQNGYALQYVKNQTNKICMAAVKQYGCTLQYVHLQTNEICMEAVKQDGLALGYVKEQTSEICMEAVKRCGIALQYVHLQTNDICMEAVKNYGTALEYPIGDP